MRRALSGKADLRHSGHPAVAAGALVAQLEQQIAPFAAPRLLNRRVIALEGQAGAFTLRTDRGDEIRAAPW